MELVRALPYLREEVLSSHASMSMICFIRGLGRLRLEIQASVVKSCIICPSALAIGTFQKMQLMY